ncbi:uncharacterized protein LOC109018884 [Juglans regia]|uniref:Uncharacterized protein LOC109018884 n=1 Tax=Juglans regia TaxID=51240 RepID=A0A6P9EIU4_JUGRE|nr:uncharacterized protein LOC109018884 [Juglans regia]
MGVARGGHRWEEKPLVVVQWPWEEELIRGYGEPVRWRSSVRLRKGLPTLGQMEEEGEGQGEPMVVLGGRGWLRTGVESAAHGETMLGLMRECDREGVCEVEYASTRTQERKRKSFHLLLQAKADASFFSSPLIFKKPNSSYHLQACDSIAREEEKYFSLILFNPYENTSSIFIFCFVSKFGTKACFHLQEGESLKLYHFGSSSTLLYHYLILYLASSKGLSAQVLWLKQFYHFGSSSTRLFHYLVLYLASWMGLRAKVLSFWLFVHTAIPLFGPLSCLLKGAKSSR